MAEPIRIEVEFSGARSVALAAGAATVSDVFLFSPNAQHARGTFKSVSSTPTPVATDITDFYILGSNGDPDGADDSAREYASADVVHADAIVSLDHAQQITAVRNGTLRAYQAGKIRVVNNGAVSVTVSAVLEEFIG